PPRRVLRDHHPDPKPGANETNHGVGNRPEGEPPRLHRAGSRAPRAMSTASSTPSPATTNSDACTPEAAATVPPMIGPKANPRATELAFNPNTVLWASDGVSSPIMLAVAGRTTPLKSPFSAIAITTMAAHGAMPSAATATATR